jgi:uncharacterized membrane protein
VVGFLRSQLLELRSAFWTLPSLITAAMIALAFLLIEIDRTSGPDGTDWAFSGDAEAARGILSTIAGSLITVAGLSFSITIVTLQLVSGQFTPRALRGFLSDRVNQSVAGAFVGIFAYCLVVLRSIRAEDTDGTNGFVPALAVTSAIGLALVALGLLLVFIHHMGQLIQVSNIAARIARATLAAVGRLYPDALGEEQVEGGRDEVTRWRAEGAPDVVRPSRPGYVRRIDEERVADTLPDGVRAHLAVHPGRFVTEAAPAVEVWPAGRLSDEQLADLGAAIEVESERDLDQDVGFGIRQLSDIALRALSPGVNDPTTAVTCIGYLQAVLERLAGRELPKEVRELGRGTRVVASRASFADYAAEAFGELGPLAAENGRVAERLREALRAVAEVAREAGADDRAEAVERLAQS